MEASPASGVQTPASGSRKQPGLGPKSVPALQAANLAWKMMTGSGMYTHEGREEGSGLPVLEEISQGRRWLD